MTNVSLHIKLQCRSCRSCCPMHCHCLNPSPSQARRRPSLPSTLLFAVVLQQVSIALHSMGQQEKPHWVPWSTKTGFRVAAEVVSLLVEIGGLCSLRFFFCSQFATAVLTTSFASGVETAGPLIDKCSNEFSMSFFTQFLSRVLILLTALAPLSG